MHQSYLSFPSPFHPSYWYTNQTGWDFFYSATDPFGHKWALQTVHPNLTTEADFDEWLAQARSVAGLHGLPGGPA